MGGYSGSYDYDDDDYTTSKSVNDYNDDHNRVYEEKIEALPPPKEKVLITKSKFPVVIAVDVTGSMREYPKMIFEKLCMLYNEVLYFLPKKLKKEFEISFAAIGDAYCDEHPIQITDFAKEGDLDKNINSLYPEGGGGGQTMETYELIAYYYNTRCKMPNIAKGIKPILIFIGDEGYYPKINRGFIERYIGDPPETDLISKEIFKELKEKFDVYILRIKYQYTDDEVKINNKWIDALGNEKVIILKDPRRVVDTILGLIAANVNKFDDFTKRIEIRQTPEQVNAVYSALDGLKTNDKIYVYDSNKCPICKTELKDKEDFCPYCGSKIVKIKNNMEVFYK